MRYELSATYFIGGVKHAYTGESGGTPCFRNLINGLETQLVPEEAEKLLSGAAALPAQPALLEVYMDTLDGATYA